MKLGPKGSHTQVKRQCYFSKSHECSLTNFSSSQEGTEREINLDDEDPTDIKMMLDFVYEKAYCVDNTGEEDAYGYEQNESDASHASTTAKCPSRRVSDTATSSLASPGESAIPSSVHFRLFLLGDKYMMPQLKSYAGTQFYLDLEGLEPDAYIKLIKAMYPIPDIEGIDKLKKMMLRQVCY